MLLARDEQVFVAQLEAEAIAEAVTLRDRVAEAVKLKI